MNFAPDNETQDQAIPELSFHREAPGMASPTQDRRPGNEILGRYVILGELGRGGMGVVYKCLDKTAGVEVALKELPPELCHSDEEMMEVKQNFQLVSKLVHQNIAVNRNVEFDSLTGAYYLIMECVEGVDLRAWMKLQQGKDAAVRLAAALPILRQVAAALDYAHAEGVVHRDVKPANVMVDARGRVKLLDFGLAAQVQESLTRLSVAGVVPANGGSTGGTPLYMSPEQWEGRAESAASDQYALAAMAYEMLAGRPPFASRDMGILRSAVLNSAPEEINGLFRPQWSAFSRALAKNRHDRFSTCTAFVEALAAKSTPPMPAKPVTTVAVPPALSVPAKSAPSVAAPKSTSGFKVFLAMVAVIGLIAVLCYFSVSRITANNRIESPVATGPAANDRLEPPTATGPASQSPSPEELLRERLQNAPVNLDVSLRSNQSPAGISNSQISNYKEYMSNYATPKVAAFWERFGPVGLSTTPSPAVISFTVAPSGRVTSFSIMTRSDNEAVNRSALAVGKALVQQGFPSFQEAGLTTEGNAPLAMQFTLKSVH